MATVEVRAYLSPSLVLLAMDWPDGATRNDFLGFAIRRTPGFKNLQTGVVAASDWLPNRLSFDGPPAEGQPDFPSNEAPIQKFMRYLMRWRLALAARTLRSGKEAISRVAERSGYESEAAFTRAFRKEFGVPPAAWRRAAS